MKLRLTALSTLLFICMIALTSCEKEYDPTKVMEFSRTGAIMSGKNEAPSNTSTGSGTLDYSYSKSSKILTYKFSWTGLTGNATAMHIHGLAPTGYSVGVIQGFSGFPTAPSGSYSGTLLVDNVVVKEENLLNGLYYVNIHTATYPGGEIRAQLSFTQ